MSPGVGTGGDQRTDSQLVAPEISHSLKAEGKQCTPDKDASRGPQTWKNRGIGSLEQKTAELQSLLEFRDRRVHLNQP